jgi:hypothetical protein
MATDTALHSNFSPCASCRAKKGTTSAEANGMQFMNCVCRRRRMVSYLLCTICIGTTPNSLAFQHVVPVSMMLASSKLNAKPNPAWNLVCRVWMTGITTFASSTQLPARLGPSKCRSSSHRTLHSSLPDPVPDVKQDSDVGRWLNFLPQDCSVLILGEANLSFSLVRRPPIQSAPKFHMPIFVVTLQLASFQALMKMLKARGCKIMLTSTTYEDEQTVLKRYGSAETIENLRDMEVTVCV